MNRPNLDIPKGFLFSAVKAGIKASGGLDFALAEAPLGASSAALFTKNRVVAAPVILGRENLKQSHGRVRAVIVNAGNANCATGEHGYKAANEVCKALAKCLSVAPEFVFPSSTGIIGVPLPTEKLVNAMPQLVAEKSSDEPAICNFSQAIMTTDTRPKFACAKFERGKKSVAMLGVAKGSGMIHPNLATMLVYIFTDVEATPAQLRKVLRESCDISFNRISVDGDTSTNDTVLLMASGASGCKFSEAGIAKKFLEAVKSVCSSLAEQIIADGEGIKHVIDLVIEGAPSDSDADKIARTIAHSMLCKTAWAGADPNWGRILAAAGRSGVVFDPTQANIFIAGHQVCRNGGAVKFDENATHEAMLKPKYDIRVAVGKGRGSARVLTTDLTSEYVRINADYST
jgi:glutamate N-acetyltransferase / amino-acid N-acetyltransferase